MIDVLLPTCNRHASLVMSLAGLAAQTRGDLRVVVADQSPQPVAACGVVQSLARILEARGGSVEFHHRLPSRGIAEQRDFLLGRAVGECALFLDDDVFLEPWVVEHLACVLDAERCGFVGAFPAGLSFRDDVRPQQQAIEFWDGPVRPEIVEPDGPAWNRRWQLHRAANLYHVSRQIPPGEVRRYKVAWVAACALYDCRKLRAVGGFAFWDRLPRYHSGEEVLVQNLLQRRYGACAIVPSGAYFSQLPSTVLNDQGTVDGHALELLPEMVRRYACPAAEPVQESNLPPSR